MVDRNLTHRGPYATAQELARARSQALADFWRGLATIDGKAQALGQYAVLQGGYQRLFETPRAYESVTADDIRKLAADLLRPGNRTVGVLTAATPAAGQGEGRCHCRPGEE